MASLSETLKSEGKFNTLLGALDAAGLTATIDSATFTLFAPTDAAFAKLPAGTAVTADVLKFHVVNGWKIPRKNGVSFDTLNEHSPGNFREISSKVTVDTCETFIWGGQETPALVSNNNINCDKGSNLVTIEDVLLPYEGAMAPQHN
jgi:uncharacterized surface protein with fasciclin (FAS1) repeats